MLVPERSSGSRAPFVQELQRLHKSTVAEAAALCASSTTIVAFPRNVSLWGVTNTKAHETASLPITRLAQDAYYSARGVCYIPNTGKATVEWFLEAEQKELLAAATNQPPVCNSLRARATAVTILVGEKCQYATQLLDATAHLASSRCGATTNLTCQSAPGAPDGLRASVIAEAARSTRIGFLAGEDAEAYLVARKAAFESAGGKAPTLEENSAMVSVTYATKMSAHDAALHSVGAVLSEGHGRNTAIDAFATELQRVVATVVADVGISPQSDLFNPLPKCTLTPFVDHVVAINNEFFSLLKAPPEVRRASEGEEETPPRLCPTDVFVRFVPKNLRCENPVTAHTCFHGMLMCYPDKIKKLHEYLQQARQLDRNPVYGIAAPNDSRQESIGIHVMVIQAHSVALEDNVTSYGLLGEPGKRLHRDGNYVLRTYRQLFALNPQLLEHHYLLPCAFESCIPLKEGVGRAFFSALDDCYALFAEHFGGTKQTPKAKLNRPTTWEFEQQSPEEAALTRAIGLGFGSPAMRIGQLVAYLQESGDANHGCPDALVSLLMSALSTLGPKATVLEAFNMMKGVINQRDDKLKEAEERVRLLALEVERLATSSPMLTADATGATVASSAWGATVPFVPDPCDTLAVALPPGARNKLMAALGLQKGAGGVIISNLESSDSYTDGTAAKLTKLIAASLKLSNVPRATLEACKNAYMKLPSKAATQTRIEAISRSLVSHTATTELYVAVVGTAIERNAHITSNTLFHHVRRDGGVRKVALCDVLEATQLGLVVLNHMSDSDQCFWYKMAD